MKTIISKEVIRLDIFLQKELQKEKSVSRNQIEQFIKKIGVKVNDKIIKKSGYKLKIDDKISFELPKQEEKKEYNVDFDIDIIYEDDDLLVINKPPYLTIHQAPSVKEATVVDWLKSKNITLSNLSGEERLGIVHRIDKETSGALVIAKNNKAHTNLSQQLANKSMGRYYIAIIDSPLKDNIVVEKNIARNPKNRLKMLASNSGKYAKTKFIKLLTSKDGKQELISAKLYTGRTHQIRAHLAYLNKHIIGDERYGFKSKKDKIIRVMLHAYILYFTHPTSGQKIFLTAPLYDDMKNYIYNIFNKKEFNEKISSNYIINTFHS